MKFMINYKKLIGNNSKKDKHFYTNFIDYKNTDFLKQFISIDGKILPRFVTKLSAKKQRKIGKSIKISRIIGLLKFINN